MESISQEKSDFKEKMRIRISENLERAKSNPIAESRLVELEQELSHFKDEFVKSGYREVETIAKEDEIEAELLRSSALADNLLEYKEMLEQIASSYGFTQEWADNLLAHENAHANVAEATKHEWVGYAAIFIKDEQGRLASIQPVNFTKPALSWGPKEVVSKNIEVIRAPEVYGNKLSEGDQASLVEDRARLEQIKLRESEDVKRIEELRKKLGAGNDN